MKITASKLKMIIAEEVAKAELEKRIIERRRARLSESRKNTSRVVNVTPQMINRIIREELEVYQQERRLAEARRRRNFI